MGQIFLSYAREDRDCAAQLARVLEGAAHSVWWDRRIGGGEEFSAEIEAELDKCDVVLVAWSCESVKSRWVRDEAAVGGDKGILVPITIDGSRPPMGFRQFHTLDLTGWKGGAGDARTAELLQSIERRLNGKGKLSPPTEQVSTAKRKFVGVRPSVILAGMLLILAAVTAYYLLQGRDQRRGPLPKPTITLLPFTTASSDPEMRDLAAQVRDSITHAMSQSGMPLRLVDSMPQDRRSQGDFLLSGELSKNADKIVATVRLAETIHGVTVLTQRFEAARDELRDLPDRVGAQVAGKLSDGAILQILDRRHPLDPALMTELLGAFAEGGLQMYQAAKRVAAKAPDAPSPQISVAFFTGFVLGELPREDRHEAVVQARRAADHALALAPEFGDTYASWCLLHSETRMAECEDHIRAGKRVDPDAPYLNLFLANLLARVGRLDESAELTRLSYSHDPYNYLKILEMLQMLEFSNENEEARRLFQQSVRRFPEFRTDFFWNRLFGLIYRGEFGRMASLEEEMGANGLPPNYTKSGAILGALKSKSRPALGRACGASEAFLLVFRCLIAAAAIGDQDSAYAIADKLYPRRVGRTPAQTEQIWLNAPNSAPLNLIASPAAAPMRRDARYLALAERVGLLAYWRNGRPPDFCRKKPEPICARLLRRPR